MNCPKCRIYLTAQPGVDDRKYGHCRKCDGRAFDFGLLLHHLNSRHVLRLVKAARTADTKAAELCPRCFQPMVPALEHRACASCQIFWFDRFEEDPNLKPRAAVAPVDEGIEPTRVAEAGTAWFIGKLGALGKRWALLNSRLLPAGKPAGAGAGALSLALVVLMLIVQALPSRLASHAGYTDERTNVDYYYSEGDTHLFNRAIEIGVNPRAPFAVPAALRATVLPFSLTMLLAAAAVLLTFGFQLERALGAGRVGLIFGAGAIGGYYFAVEKYAPLAPRLVVGPAAALAAVIAAYALKAVLHRRAETPPASGPAAPSELTTLLFWSSMAALVYLGAQVTGKFHDQAVTLDSRPLAGAAIGAILALVL